MEYLQIYEKNQKKVRIKNPLLYWKNGRAVYCLCLLYKRNKHVSVGSNPTFSIKNQKKVNMYTYPLEIGTAVAGFFVLSLPLHCQLFYLSVIVFPIIIPSTEILVNEVVCPVVDTLGHQIYDFIYPPIIEPEIIPEVIDVVPAVIDDYEGRTEIDDQENPVSVHWYSLGYNLGSYLGELLIYRFAYNLPARYLPRNLPRNRPIPIGFKKAEVIAWLMLAGNIVTRIYFLIV